MTSAHSPIRGTRFRYRDKFFVESIDSQDSVSSRMRSTLSICTWRTLLTPLLFTVRSRGRGEVQDFLNSLSFSQSEITTIYNPTSYIESHSLVYLNVQSGALVHLSGRVTSTRRRLWENGTLFPSPECERRPSREDPPFTSQSWLGGVK